MLVRALLERLLRVALIGATGLWALTHPLHAQKPAPRLEVVGLLGAAHAGALENDFVIGAGIRGVVLGNVRTQRQPNGVTEVITPSWMTQVVIGGLLNLQGAGHDTLPVSLIGHVSLLRQFASGPLKGVGPVVAGSINPVGAGVLVRAVTSFGAAGLSVGAMSYEHVRGAQLVVLIEISAAVVRDVTGR